MAQSYAFYTADPLKKIKGNELVVLVYSFGEVVSFYLLIALTYLEEAKHKR